MRLNRALTISMMAILLLPASALLAYQNKQLCFPSLNLQDVNLKEAVRILHETTTHFTYDKAGVNFLIDTDRISEAQLTQRFSFQAQDIPIEHVIWAICRQLGLGYRIDTHAVFISSRSHVGLRVSPTKELQSVPDGLGKQRYLVLVISADKKAASK